MSILTVSVDGKSSSTEATFAIDGKDYPVTGDPDVDSYAFKSPNSNTLVISEKKNGKAIAQTTIVVSADGLSETVTRLSTGADGKAMKTLSVWTRQPTKASPDYDTGASTTAPASDATKVSDYSKTTATAGPGADQTVDLKTGPTSNQTQSQQTTTNSQTRTGPTAGSTSSTTTVETQRGKVEVKEVKTVFYATNRKRGPDTSDHQATYTSDVGPGLSYGVAQVTIPKGHKAGKIEQPLIPFVID
ncbi:MAG: hypothetical protein WAW96_19110, partial [Alphaproteobacteria bacterium]